MFVKTRGFSPSMPEGANDEWPGGASSQGLSFCKAYSCLALCLQWLRCGHAAGWRGLTDFLWDESKESTHESSGSIYPIRSCNVLSNDIEEFIVKWIRNGGFQSIGVHFKNQPYFNYMIGFSIINRSFWGSLEESPILAMVIMVIMVPSSSGVRLWGLHEHLCSWSNSHDQGHQLTAFASGNDVENHPWIHG